jgi:hypothetical protein
MLGRSEVRTNAGLKLTPSGTQLTSAIGTLSTRVKHMPFTQIPHYATVYDFIISDYEYIHSLPLTVIFSNIPPDFRLRCSKRGEKTKAYSFGYTANSCNRYVTTLV